jgi:hypothetical protein
MSARRSSSSIKRSFWNLVVAMAFVGTLAVAQPSAAEWEGSKAEDITAKVLDAVIVRPLAVARVAVGAAFMIPSAVFAWPGGREGIDTAYEVLIAGPAEYAFDRKLGEF